MSWTRKTIASIIPMYNLTIEGIEEAMDYLRKAGIHQYTTVERFKNFPFPSPKFY
jgi:hypothetical protein